MISDFFRYKKNFVTIALILSYAFIHVKLTGIYIDAPLDKMVDFSVRLPFGQRILVPMLVHYLHILLPVQLDYLFFSMECLFTALMYFALFYLLRCEFEPKQSQVLSWLFILLLPLVTIINYSLGVQSNAPFYFAYDTPTLFFMALGFLLCLRAQWWYFIPLVFLATINRESGFLLILLIPVLHWQKLRTVYKQVFFTFIAYFLARLLILSFISDAQGPWIEWDYNHTGLTHFLVNIQWLIARMHFTFFIFCFAGLPLFWFAFYDYIPLVYRPIRYLALLYFLMLLLVGNFFEARIFGELVILLYLPVCVALNRWLCDLQPIIPENVTGVWYYIDRYVVLTVLISVVVFRQFLNFVLEYLISV